MQKPCSICVHEKVVEIDAALIKGGSVRDLAGRFGTSKSALGRHRAHIERILVKARKKVEKLTQNAIAKQAAKAITRDIAHGETLLDRLLEVHRVTREILSEARDSKDSNTALRAIARLEKQLELEARLLGELKDVVPAPPPPFDLSRLSAEELSHLEVVMERATIRGRTGELSGEQKQILDV